MHKHTLEVLELEKILTEVRGFAATELAGEIIEQLQPVNDITYIRTRLAEVTAAVDILSRLGRPPFGGINDIRKILKKSTRGIVLTREEIRNIRRALYGFRNLKSYFDKLEEEVDPRVLEDKYAVILDEIDKMKLLPGLERKIDKVIDDDGSIKDTASKKLASLRSKIGDLENRIRDKLDSIIRSKDYRSMLQESLVTRRENRYVVPVKKEYSGTFSGIVHDRSASGMTLFMEPMAVVKLNNRLREIKKEEEREIFRIMQKLTAAVEETADTLEIDLKTAILIDVIFARAGYSRSVDGSEPEINEEGSIEIVAGRHPLLQDEPVPIDVEVGKDFRALVITGPNTGGKTVALKTIGLFVLMVETGLHIPASPKSNISIFNKVFADIGDEQSIEQNLSTFSSHMNKIKYYLKNADEESLILLDELGAGTDPREGAALGIAVLEELRHRRAVCTATTHYSQLKSYAFSTEGVKNASVEFDIETLQPTYRLIMGVPGGSNAFEIALKLGLPTEIVDGARDLIDERELKVEDIIDELNAERKKYRELRQEAEDRNRKVRKLEEKYEKRLAELEREEEEILSRAREEAERLIKRVRKQTKSIVRNLRDRDFTVRSEVDREASKINEELKEIEEIVSEEPAEKEVEPADKEIAVGDRVRIRSVGSKGEVIEVDESENEATVQAGVMKVTAGLEDLVQVEEPEGEERELIKKYRTSKSGQVSPRLDLRGTRYEEAQRKVDKYLDNVFLAGYNEVEIIHGKGTGALRQAVREVLEENPHTAEYRPGRREEGGAGVTIVTIDHH